jgi:hypothetical protein
VEDATQLDGVSAVVVLREDWFSWWVCFDIGLGDGNNPMSEGAAVLPPKLCSPVVLDPVLAVEAAIVSGCALLMDQPSMVV